MKFKHYFAGLLAAFSLSLLIAPPQAEAKKRYRYIKRMHGVRALWDVTPFQRVGGVNIIFPKYDVGLAYSYNHKGWFEFGPAVSVAGGAGAFGFEGGLFAEYNFIKNRGKRKQVPAVGLQIGAGKPPGPQMEFNLEISPYFSYKHFVAKRTALIATLGYTARVPFSGFSDFRNSLQHDSFLMGGFSYYFDFY